MKTSLLSAVVALTFMSTAQAADKAVVEPPVQFLQTDNPAAQRALATKITADFHDATIREVVDYLAHTTQMNTVLKLDADPPQAVGAAKDVDGRIPGAPVPPGAPSAPKNELKITRKFEGVPLRTALYRISQDTGLTIEWLLLDNKKPFMIRNQ